MDDVLINVDPELLKKIEQLSKGSNRNPWTPEKEALLLKYWPTKNHQDLAAVLGVHVNTALNKYKELTFGRD